MCLEIGMKSRQRNVSMDTRRGNRRMVRFEASVAGALRGTDERRLHPQCCPTMPEQFRPSDTDAFESRISKPKHDTHRRVTKGVFGWNMEWRRRSATNVEVTYPSVADGFERMSPPNALTAGYKTLSRTRSVACHRYRSPRRSSGISGNGRPTVLRVR